MCRFGAALAAVLAIGVSGCAGMSEDFKQQMFLGETFYVNGKFYESIGNYTKAREFAENNDQRYKATLGVANAATEYGLIVYQTAETLLRNRNRKAGMEKCGEADKWHDTANRAFALLLEMRPKDTIANYYLGLFLYKRATSFSELPYPGTKEGMAQRRKERDEAVHQFQIVLAHESGDITLSKHVGECKSPHVHRYVALALFARSDWDKRDCEDARRHLMVYLNFLKRSQTLIVDSHLSSDNPEQAKLEKEQKLERLRREISDTRAILHEQHKGLKVLVETWEKPAGDLPGDKPGPPKDKKEAWLNAVKVEIAALHDLTREFEEAAAATRKAAEKPTGENN